MGNNEFPITFESEHLESDVRKIVANETFAQFRDSNIDHIFGGIHDRLYILGAQPGAGKSTLFLQWADELAEDGHVVLFANLEMPRSELVRKSLSRLGQGALTLKCMHSPAFAAKLEETVERYRKSIAGNIMFTDKPVSPVDLSVYASKIQRERGVPPIVFVDYIQIMPSASDRSFVEERAVIKETVAGLRRIANGHGCPVFAISSIRRQDYPKKKTGLDALAEAQSLEYGADVVAFLSTSRENDSPSPFDPTLQPSALTVVKNRYGATGSVELLFDTKHATFAGSTLGQE